MPSNEELINVLAVGRAAEVEPLVGALIDSGFSVDVVPSVDDMLAPGRLRRYWLVVVDDTLAEVNVLALIRRVREVSEIPIVAVTASDLEETVVALLDAGADQCLTKPVRLRELVARVRAALRRTSAPEQEPGAIEIDGVFLDPAGFHLTVAGREVSLTAKEFALLHFLMVHAGQTLTRRQIVDRIWADESTEGKTLDTHVRRLRQKLEDDSSRPARILTVRKVGYRYQRHQVNRSRAGGAS